MGFAEPGEKITEGGNAPVRSPDFSSLVQSRIDTGVDPGRPIQDTNFKEVLDTPPSPVPTSADTVKFLKKKQDELIGRGYTRDQARTMIERALAKQG